MKQAPPLFFFAALLMFIAILEGLYFLIQGFNNYSGLNSAYIICSIFGFFLALNSILHFKSKNQKRGTFLFLLAFLALLLLNGSLMIDKYVLS
ncbi:hypothetical protein IMZ08_17970 [Bacillus luteolus]|uniref:Uncharacterized protein n=1 Tax=Litchfieldia luteola TaxID=682179 RepID=A0ABR9QN40_9BACI|nr:hypothetical protein [Cytobacillus luteolus]MBE4909926.1 hypothetical protein [Cytobacillus luteolus]MBP1942518.1 hypothetical protein [Cytobacillus luteolus]